MESPSTTTTSATSTNVSARATPSTATRLATVPREGATIELPTLEDSVSVQLAIFKVVPALAVNAIEPKRAVLLYGLQLAARNAGGLETVADPSSSYARSTAPRIMAAQPRT